MCNQNGVGTGKLNICACLVEVMGYFVLILVFFAVGSGKLVMSTF